MVVVAVVVVMRVGHVQDQNQIAAAAFPKVVAVFNVIPALLAALANVLALAPAQRYARVALVQTPAAAGTPAVYVASL